MDMMQKDISKQFISLTGDVRNINGVMYLKLSKQFTDSYKDILNNKTGYVKLMPLAIGNNTKEIRLFVPTKPINKLNEVVGYIGEIVSK